MNKTGIIANIIWSNDSMKFEGKVTYMYDSHIVIDGVVTAGDYIISTDTRFEQNNKISYLESVEIISNCALLIRADLDKFRN